MGRDIEWRAGKITRSLGLGAAMRPLFHSEPLPKVCQWAFGGRRWRSQGHCHCRRRTSPLRRGCTGPQAVLLPDARLPGALVGRALARRRFRPGGGFPALKGPARARCHVTTAGKRHARAQALLRAIAAARSTPPPANRAAKTHPQLPKLDRAFPRDLALFRAPAIAESDSRPGWVHAQDKPPERRTPRSRPG